MINTIEIAPSVLAASLAKHIWQSYWVYPCSTADGEDYLTETQLRKLIQDFLTKDLP